MNLARRAPRGCAAVAWALVFVAVSSGRAGAQEESPAPTAKPPPPFEFDRAVGPLAFEVDFKLADKDEAHLQILFDEPDERDWLTFQEREIFGMDFHPFEGARFVLSRSTINAPLVSSLLAQVPEPKDLEFKLRIELPQEGGLAVTMADGMPIVIARTPRARKMKVQFAASGGVVAFTATKAERARSFKLDQVQTLALERLVAFPPERSDRIWGWSATLGPEIERPVVVPGPLKQVRQVDQQPVEGGVVERLVAEFEEGIESPLIVVRPVVEETMAALLVVTAEKEGIESDTVRAALTRGIAAGQLVAAFETIGAGERRSILPHDDLRVPELELTGASSFDLAVIEAAQLLDWLRARPDVDPTKITVTGPADGANVAERVQRVERELDHPVLFSRLLTTTSEMPKELVRIGDDYLHLRFDSCQLLRALERREMLPPPDDSIPLRDRAYDQWGGAVMTMGMFTIVLPPGEDPVKWTSSETPPPFSKHVTIAASDRGMRVALEEAAARLPPRDDETYVALNEDQLRFVCCGVDSLDLEEFFKDLGKALGPKAEPPRFFADGSTALALLTSMLNFKTSITAADVKFPVASFTACHAIPSFDILLQRPFRAHRADPSLEVLTQGMPEWVFVENALTRFEIEDVAIALMQRGLKIDWLDPVDALRRPLTRHDRLAMWPQVRHAEFVR